MTGFTVHLNSMTGTQFSNVDQSCKRVHPTDSRLKAVTCKSIGITDKKKCDNTKLWLSGCNVYDVGKAKVQKLECAQNGAGYLCDGVKPITTAVNPACNGVQWCSKVGVKYKKGSSCPDEDPLLKRGESFTRNFYCPVSEVKTDKCKVVLGNNSQAKEYCGTGSVDPKYNWLMMPSSRH